MARPKSQTLTEAEQRIMHVLWSLGEANVRQITDHLAAQYNLAYTTVLTTTRILADKGYVRFRKDGRTHVFTPLVSKQSARSSAIGNVIRNLFDGSPRALAQHLIEVDGLTPADIAQLRSLVEADDEGEGK